ncbi:hypothetical protein [Aestuariibaculum sediminum]|uniref:Uncharacterized protein n=1 Tax=Aestuariibaculum sediminum TaxID=2770637 RepID=A0A8J6UDS0_9FLAO|nr:hypothetical protein [Aestuariibaculum sediminum]MBD0833099.1 hypothetical protein [Aestuariibaculum sediminum]
MLRNVFLPLSGDEITYLKISENILQGRYYLGDKPSSLAPVISLILTFFKISIFPILGFVLNKLFNIALVFLGLRLIYKVLLELNVNKSIAIAIVAFTIVNPTSVAWFSRLYPEAVLFYLFWGFIYYSILEASKSNLLKLLIFFALLVFTRYVYAILGVIVLIKYFDYYKFYKESSKLYLVLYSFILLFPFLIWAKYLINVERNDLSEISYFKRFKIDNPIIYNIKCGLGLIKHYEVSRVNGLPAFVSLFVPKTGLRSFSVSLILILGFIYGYISNFKFLFLKRVGLPILLIMLGLIIAGTGFSRYWLVLLPGIYLGFYLTLKSFGLIDNVFINLVKFISLVYIVNEFRLNVLVLNQYF